MNGTEMASAQRLRELPQLERMFQRLDAQLGADKVDAVLNYALRLGLHQSSYRNEFYDLPTKPRNRAATLIMHPARQRSRQRSWKDFVHTVIAEFYELLYEKLDPPDLPGEWRTDSQGRRCPAWDGGKEPRTQFARNIRRMLPASTELRDVLEKVTRRPIDIRAVVRERSAAVDRARRNLHGTGRDRAWVDDAPPEVRAVWRLRELLLGGPQRPSEVRAILYRKGVSERQLRRALCKLRVRTRREGTQWLWELPLSPAAPHTGSTPGTGLRGGVRNS